MKKINSIQKKQELMLQIHAPNTMLMDRNVMIDKVYDMARFVHEVIAIRLFREPSLFSPLKIQTN